MAASVRETLEQYDLFDNAIIQHGFAEYNRDYRIVAELHVGRAMPGTYGYVFRGCMAASYASEVPQFLPGSMDDTFIDYAVWQAAGEPDGYVWGVNWANVYPGWTYVEDSPLAAEWSGRAGIPMHEVRIETNVYALTLVFADLHVARVLQAVSPGIASTFIPLQWDAEQAHEQETE